MRSRPHVRVVARHGPNSRCLANVALVSCLALLPPGVSRGAQVTIAFDTYPGGAAVPGGASIADQWQSLGVIFSDGAGGAVGASNNNCSLSAPNHAYASTIVARFVDPVTGAAAATSYAGTAQDNCWVPGEGIAMRAYDRHGAQIGSVFNSGGGHFEAFSFPEPVIARLEMDCVLQGIDDFVFGEPVTLAVEASPLGLALHPMANPALAGRLAIAVTLTERAAARLEVFGASGRRELARDLVGLGPGRHVLQLNEDRRLRPGVYLVRLSDGPHAVVTRVALLD